MLLINKKSVRLSQPHGPVEIDWGNPITRGLKIAATPVGNTMRDAVSGALMTTSGSPTSVVKQAGRALKTVSASSQYGYFPCPVSNLPLTLFVQHTLDSSATGAVISLGTNGGTERFVLFYGAVAGSYSASAFPNSAGTAGQIVASIAIQQTAGVIFNSNTLGTPFCNGVIGAQGTDTFLGSGLCTRMYLSARNSTVPGSFSNQCVNVAMAFNRALSDAEIKALSDNPWQIFKPATQSIFIPIAASGTTTYTLTAQQGSYSAAGQSATLLKSKLITTSSGSYSITGRSANLNYIPPASVYTLTALRGTYSLNGQSTSLLKSKVLVASSGTYSLTGQSAIVSRNRNLTVSRGAYALTGRSANLTYTPTTPVYTITAQVGSYTLTGQAATLIRHRSLTAQTGAYTYTGRSIQLDKYAAGSGGGLVKYLDVLAGELLILKPLGASTPAGASAWGSITGTLSAQTDLQAALDLKTDLTVFHDPNKTVTAAVLQGPENDNLYISGQDVLVGAAASVFLSGGNTFDPLGTGGEMQAFGGSGPVRGGSFLFAGGSATPGFGGVGGNLDLYPGLGDGAGANGSITLFNGVAGGSSALQISDTGVDIPVDLTVTTINGAAYPPSGAVSLKQVTLDFGTVPVYSKAISFTDAEITALSKVSMTPHGTSDELEMDGFICAVKPAAGTAIAYIQAVPGPVTGTRIFNYLIG